MDDSAHARPMERFGTDLGRQTELSGPPVVEIHARYPSGDIGWKKPPPSCSNDQNRRGGGLSIMSSAQ